MQTEILYRPSYSLARVTLVPAEEIRVEGGAMVAMSDGVTIETKMAGGGILKSLARSVLGGESFFVNTYRAPAQGGQVMLAPALPGDLAMLEMQNNSLMLQSGAFIASAMTVSVDASWGGSKTFFASEGLVMLKASGVGPLLVSSYGAIHDMGLAAGQKVTVDTGHLVAFDQSVGFQVRRVGGIKSTLLSGEGLVVDLTGPGRVLIQTRSTDSFISWIASKMPKQNSR